MSPTQDITKKTQPATKGAVCRNESENPTAHALACENQFGPIDPDLLHHHNGRGTARQQKQPEPTEELDYESEGMIPHN